MLPLSKEPGRQVELQLSHAGWKEQVISINPVCKGLDYAESWDLSFWDTPSIRAVKVAEHLAILVGPQAIPLRTLLPELLGGISCLEFSELYVAVPKLKESEATSIWIDAQLIGNEDLGALRLLGSLQPDAMIVLLCRPGQEESMEEAAALGIKILAIPLETRRILQLLKPLRNRGTDLRDDFIAGLADQLNNPLAALAGRLQLLEIQLPHDAAKDLKDNLDLAMDSSKRIQRAIGKLSRLSEQKAATIALVPLLPLIRELARDIGPAEFEIPKKGTEVFLVRADLDLCRIAFDGLFRTSLDLLAGTARLELQFLPGDEHSTTLLRFMEPIPLPCRLEEIFRAFSLGRQLTDPDLGLDLCLARHLFVSQGGGLNATSQAGFLTGFCVLLPSGAV